MEWVIIPLEIRKLRSQRLRALSKKWEADSVLELLSPSQGSLPTSLDLYTQGQGCGVGGGKAQEFRGRGSRL